MLLWYIRFRGFGLSPAETQNLARLALEYNRALRRDKYTPIRIGMTIIPLCRSIV